MPSSTSTMVTSSATTSEPTQKMSTIMNYGYDNVTNETMNLTMGDNSEESFFQAVYLGYLWTALIIGLPGNVLIAIVYIVVKHKRTSDWFIFFLSVYDCAVCVFAVPLYLSIETGAWMQTGSDLACKIEQFTIFTAQFSSVSILGIIAVDRYLKICHPTKRSLSAIQARNLGLCTPLVSAMVAAPILVWDGNVERRYCRIQEQYKHTLGVKIHLSLTFGFFVFMFLMVIFCYSHVCVVVRRRIKRHRENALKRKHLMQIPAFLQAISNVDDLQGLNSNSNNRNKKRFSLFSIGSSRRLSAISPWIKARLSLPNDNNIGRKLIVPSQEVESTTVESFVDIKRQLDSALMFQAKSSTIQERLKDNKEAFNHISVESCYNKDDGNNKELIEIENNVKSPEDSYRFRSKHDKDNTSNSKLSKSCINCFQFASSNAERPKMKYVSTVHEHSVTQEHTDTDKQDDHKDSQNILTPDPHSCPEVNELYTRSESLSNSEVNSYYQTPQVNTPAALQQREISDLQNQNNMYYHDALSTAINVDENGFVNLTDGKVNQDFKNCSTVRNISENYETEHLKNENVRISPDTCKAGFRRSHSVRNVSASNLDYSVYDTHSCVPVTINCNKYLTKRSQSEIIDIPNKSITLDSLGVGNTDLVSKNNSEEKKLSGSVSKCYSVRSLFTRNKKSDFMQALSNERNLITRCISLSSLVSSKYKAKHLDAALSNCNQLKTHSDSDLLINQKIKFAKLDSQLREIIHKKRIISLADGEIINQSNNLRRSCEARLQNQPNENETETKFPIACLKSLCTNCNKNRFLFQKGRGRQRIQTNMIAHEEKNRHLPRTETHQVDLFDRPNNRPVHSKQGHDFDILINDEDEDCYDDDQTKVLLKKSNKYRRTSLQNVLQHEADKMKNCYSTGSLSQNNVAENYHMKLEVDSIEEHTGIIMKPKDLVSRTCFQETISPSSDFDNSVFDSEDKKDMTVPLLSRESSRYNSSKNSKYDTSRQVYYDNTENVQLDHCNLSFVANNFCDQPSVTQPTHMIDLAKLTNVQENMGRLGLPRYDKSLRMKSKYDTQNIINENTTKQAIQCSNYGSFEKSPCDVSTNPEPTDIHDKGSDETESVHFDYSYSTHKLFDPMQAVKQPVLQRSESNVFDEASNHSESNPSCGIISDQQLLKDCACCSANQDSKLAEPATRNDCRYKSQVFCSDQEVFSDTNMSVDSVSQMCGLLVYPQCKQLNSDENNSQACTQHSRGLCSQCKQLDSDESNSQACTQHSRGLCSQCKQLDSDKDSSQTNHQHSIIKGSISETKDGSGKYTQVRGNEDINNVAIPNIIHTPWDGTTAVVTDRVIQCGKDTMVCCYRCGQMCNCERHININRCNMKDCMSCSKYISCNQSSTHSKHIENLNLTSATSILEELPNRDSATQETDSYYKSELTHKPSSLKDTYSDCNQLRTDNFCQYHVHTPATLSAHNSYIGASSKCQSACSKHLPSASQMGRNFIGNLELESQSHEYGTNTDVSPCIDINQKEWIKASNKWNRPDMKLNSLPRSRNQIDPLKFSVDTECYISLDSLNRSFYEGRDEAFRTDAINHDNDLLLSDDNQTSDRSHDPRTRDDYFRFNYNYNVDIGEDMKRVCKIPNNFVKFDTCRCVQCLLAILTEILPDTNISMTENISRVLARIKLFHIMRRNVLARPSSYQQYINYIETVIYKQQIVDVTTPMLVPPSSLHFSTETSTLSFCYHPIWDVSNQQKFNARSLCNIFANIDMNTAYSFVCSLLSCLQDGSTVPEPIISSEQSDRERVAYIRSLVIDSSSSWEPSSDYVHSIFTNNQLDDKLSTTFCICKHVWPCQSIYDYRNYICPFCLKPFQLADYPLLPKSQMCGLQLIQSNTSILDKWFLEIESIQSDYKSIVELDSLGAVFDTNTTNHYKNLFCCCNLEFNKQEFAHSIFQFRRNKLCNEVPYLYCDHKHNMFELLNNVSRTGEIDTHGKDISNVMSDRGSYENVGDSAPGNCSVTDDCYFSNIHSADSNTKISDSSTASLDIETNSICNIDTDHSLKSCIDYNHVNKLHKQHDQIDDVSDKNIDNESESEIVNKTDRKLKHGLEIVESTLNRKKNITIRPSLSCTTISELPVLLHSGDIVSGDTQRDTTGYARNYLEQPMLTSKSFILRPNDKQFKLKASNIVNHALHSMVPLAVGSNKPTSEKGNITSSTTSIESQVVSSPLINENDTASCKFFDAIPSDIEVNKNDNCENAPKSMNTFVATKSIHSTLLGCVPTLQVEDVDSKSSLRDIHVPDSHTCELFVRTVFDTLFSSNSYPFKSDPCLSASDINYSSSELTEIPLSPLLRTNIEVKEDGSQKLCDSSIFHIAGSNRQKLNSAFDVYEAQVRKIRNPKRNSSAQSWFSLDDLSGRPTSSRHASMVFLSSIRRQLNNVLSPKSIRQFFGATDPQGKNFGRRVPFSSDTLTANQINVIITRCESLVMDKRQEMGLPPIRDRAATLDPASLDKSSRSSYESVHSYPGTMQNIESMMKPRTSSLDTSYSSNTQSDERSMFCRSQDFSIGGSRGTSIDHLSPASASYRMGSMCSGISTMSKMTECSAYTEHSRSDCEKITRRTAEREHNITKLLGVITIIFVISWSVSWSVILIDNLTVIPVANMLTTNMTLSIARNLFLVNHVCNILVYAVLSQSFREKMSQCYKAWMNCCSF